MEKTNYQRLKTVLWQMVSFNRLYKNEELRKIAFDLYHTLTVSKQAAIREYVDSFNYSYAEYDADDIISILEFGC